MVIRPLCFAGLVALAVGCTRPSLTPVVAPASESGASEMNTLVFPAFDSATLASLSALLEGLRQQSSLLSTLTAPEPRMYALFRELEATQAKLNAVLSATDVDGQSLYDRLSRLTSQTDSLFRVLEQVNPQPARP